MDNRITDLLEEIEKLTKDIKPFVNCLEGNNFLAFSPEELYYLYFEETYDKVMIERYLFGDIRVKVQNSIINYTNKINRITNDIISLTLGGDIND